MFYLICTFSSSVEISAPSNKHHKKVEMILNKQVKIRSPKMFLNMRRKAYWRICGIFFFTWLHYDRISEKSLYQGNCDSSFPRETAQQIRDMKFSFCC